MSNPLPIEIETKDKELEFNLMGNTVELAVDDDYKLPDGSALVWKGRKIDKSSGVRTLEFSLVPPAKANGGGAAASYISEKVVGHASTVRINRQTVPVEKEAISRALAGSP